MGVSQACPRKKRTLTVSVFMSAKPNIARNNSARKSHDSGLMNLIKAKRRHLFDAAAQNTAGPIPYF
jgi:hypothetical protein